jgi:phosphoribosylglycinamide formyltransferase-1
MSRPTRFGVLASTGGAVLSRMLESAWFRSRLAIVAADRPCGAIERAAAAGIPVALVLETDPVRREQALSTAFQQQEVDHILLFYTRLLRHELLERFRDRLWNLHPSLLPAFPGAHGFEDAMAAGARVLGTTLHLVDEGMDTGPVLLQSVFARMSGATERELRHVLFTQQVRGALQACRWLAAGRVSVHAGRVLVRDEPAPWASDGTLFTPGLDDPEARSLPIPSPSAMELKR